MSREPGNRRSASSSSSSAASSSSATKDKLSLTEHQLSAIYKTLKSFVTEKLAHDESLKSMLGTIPPTLEFIGSQYESDHEVMSYQKNILNTITVIYSQINITDTKLLKAKRLEYRQVIRELETKLHLPMYTLLPRMSSIRKSVMNRKRDKKGKGKSRKSVGFAELLLLSESAATGSPRQMEEKYNELKTKGYTEIDARIIAGYTYCPDTEIPLWIDSRYFMDRNELMTMAQERAIQRNKEARQAFFTLYQQRRPSTAYSLKQLGFFSPNENREAQIARFQQVFLEHSKTKEGILTEIEALCQEIRDEDNTLESTLLTLFEEIKNQINDADEGSNFRQIAGI